MTMTVRKVSDYQFTEEREIGSLQELKNLDEEFGGYGLIITFEESGDVTVWIYDGYFE